MRNIYENYTDMVESFGLDECWLDVGGSRRLFGDGEIIAELIREEVKKRTGLTVSVGVSFNKIFAKLGSDMKKPDATTVITRDDFTQKVWPLCVNELLYVGRATVKKLNSCGIFTIGDLAKASVQSLKGMFGKNGITLWRFANGLDDSPVQYSGHRELQKSIGRSTTGRKDLESIREIQHVITALCEDVSRRLREQELYAGIITVWMRDKKFTAQTHQQRLVFPTRLSEIMYHEAVKLIADHWDGIPLRSVGVSVSCLQHEEETLQYSFYCDVSRYKRWEQKEAGVDCLRRRFGNDIIMRASQMNRLYDLSNGGEHCSFSHIAR